MHEDNPAVTNVCFSPNGRFVLAFSLDSSIRLWDYVSGSVKKTYQGHTNKGFSIGGCFGVLTDADDGVAEEDADHESPRHQAFITSPSEDGDIFMWDVGSKRVIQRIEGAHKGVCFSVDVNGATMVSAGQDGLIKVFKHRPKPHKAAPEVNGHMEMDVDDALNLDEELQRQVEAEAEAEAGSPERHVKEEQV